MRVLEKVRVAVEQNIADVGAFADSAELEAGGQCGGQILQAVDREVGSMFEQGDFEFLGEKTLWQRSVFFRERRGLEFVAGGLDDLEFEGEPGKCRAALSEHRVRLSQGQRTAAGGDKDSVFRVQAFQKTTV